MKCDTLHLFTMIHFRILLSFSAAFLLLTSCEDSNRMTHVNEIRQENGITTAATPTVNRDSIFYLHEFLIRAGKGARFERLMRGEKPKLRTKGDTLYMDRNIVLIGNKDEIIGNEIFIKFQLKSAVDAFTTNTMYAGKLADPDFTSDPASNLFITRITEGCKDIGINFAVS